MDMTFALLYSVSLLKRTYTHLFLLSVSPVVTGATDGIGKSYAEEVRLLDPY